MTQRARLVEREHGLVPEGEGWYVLNAREAQWEHIGETGSWLTFEGDPGFGELGINLNILDPGQPLAMYHAEDTQEGFLVLAGEAVLIVDDEEVPLKPWDYAHCPPMTPHIVVARGDRPCMILAVGSRRQGRARVYPVSEPAARYGASVAAETTSSKEAYADWLEPHSGPAPELP